MSILAGQAIFEEDRAFRARTSPEAAVYTTHVGWPPGLTSGNLSTICCCAFRRNADICSELTMWLDIIGA
ncbi:hypothetical protein [Mycobacteroides saopaulense]|uniref:hypothetical protein n=1 Tax=Mycobacteroides saopaulense TaxID=1578165 RepID=UPI001055F46E|nr:hypothetical protein [Mycobacteroides saopaulense]